MTYIFRHSLGRTLWLLNLLDLITQFGCTFIVFILNGIVQVTPEFDEKHPFLGVIGSSHWYFARVLACPVIVQNESVNLFVEKIVVVGTTEVTPASEIMKTHPADGTRLLVEFLKFLGGFIEQHLLGNPLRKGRCQTSHEASLCAGTREVLLGMFIAKVKFLRFGSREHRKMLCCQFIAFLTFHTSDHSNTFTPRFQTYAEKNTFRRPTHIRR